METSTRFVVRPHRPEAPGTEVLVGPGTRGQLARELALRFAGRPVAVVADRGVLVGWRGFVDGLAPFTVLEVPAGEPAKQPAVLVEVLRALARAELPRRGLVLAFGGGATGDLAGLAAALWHRGVELVQVPTSLLAMVDAALGGKCAVNLPEGKNLAGVFWEARLVVVDPELLATLPMLEFRAGLGEVAKYALGFSTELLDLCERRHDLGPLSDPVDLAAIVARCLRIKAAIVEEDPLETRGRRALLNLGHTTAHALEAWAAAKGGTIPHGLAVAFGLRVALHAARARGRVDDAAHERALMLCDSWRLPAGWAELAPGLPRPGVDDLVPLLRRDKKRDDDSLRVVLPKALGACETDRLPTGQWAGWIGELLG
ncbi:MAG: 3-dehydroquinate synthase family protein [Planctomycetota bacterium]